MGQKILLFFIIACSFIVTISLVKNIYGLFKSGSRLQREEQVVKQLENENYQLREKITQAQQAEYIEQIARDQLNLSRAGETVVVLPRPPAVSTQQEMIYEDRSNWERWWQLFFQ